MRTGNSLASPGTAPGTPARASIVTAPAAEGYIMVVLLVAMAVTAVWMGAALPAWRQQVIREREAELIFRGEQYARAIYLYRQKNGGQVSPPNIDILVSQKYLRRKYLDPMTGKDFLPLGGAGAIGGTAGVTGVRSTSNDASIVIYRNQQVYSQFPFDWPLEAHKAGRQQQQPAGQGRQGPAGNRGTGTGPTRGGPGTGGPPPPPPPPGRGPGAGAPRGGGVGPGTGTGPPARGR